GRLRILGADEPRQRDLAARARRAQREVRTIAGVWPCELAVEARGEKAVALHARGNALREDLAEVRRRAIAVRERARARRVCILAPYDVRHAAAARREERDLARVDVTVAVAILED